MGSAIWDLQLREEPVPARQQRRRCGTVCAVAQHGHRYRHRTTQSRIRSRGQEGDCKGKMAILWDEIRRLTRGDHHCP